jgi:hypothetical protein
MLPGRGSGQSSIKTAVDNAVMQMLTEMRHGSVYGQPLRKRSRIEVVPGYSVVHADSEGSTSSNGSD